MKNGKQFYIILVKLLKNCKWSDFFLYVCKHKQMKIKQISIYRSIFLLWITFF